MGKAIRDLKQVTKIIILPADKGKSTVVMEHYEYVTKMNALLKDNTANLERIQLTGLRPRLAKP